MIGGRLPIATKFEIPSLNGVVLIPSVKIETIKNLSSSLVQYQKSKENTIDFTSSRSSIKKYDSVLGRKEGVSLVKTRGVRPQGVRR